MIIVYRMTNLVCTTQYRGDKFTSHLPGRVILAFDSGNAMIENSITWNSLQCCDLIFIPISIFNVDYITRKTILQHISLQILITMMHKTPISLRYSITMNKLTSVTYIIKLHSEIIYQLNISGTWADWIVSVYIVFSRSLQTLQYSMYNMIPTDIVW